VYANGRPCGVDAAAMEKVAEPLEKTAMSSGSAGRSFGSCASITTWSISRPDKAELQVATKTEGSAALWSIARLGSAPERGVTETCTSRPGCGWKRKYEGRRSAWPSIGTPSCSCTACEASESGRATIE